MMKESHRFVYCLIKNPGIIVSHEMNDTYKFMCIVYFTYVFLARLVDEYMTYILADQPDFETPCTLCILYILHYSSAS